MLNVRHRFHGYGSLKSVYSRGQIIRGPFLTLRIGRRDPARPYRVAVVISRKVHKSAVMRNRIRRRIFEVVRKQSELIKPGSDLIFNVYSDKLAELPAPDLEKIIKKLLEKA